MRSWPTQVPASARLAGIEGPNLSRRGRAVGPDYRHSLCRPGIGTAACGPAESRMRSKFWCYRKKFSTSALATETPQPIAALVQPPQWSWEQLLVQGQKKTPLILVLAGLQDPGNLGSILRSAEAFGATGIVALTGTVSAWNPKAVRASAGSVFRVPLIATSVEECIPRLHRAEATIFATGSRAAKEAHQANLAGPVALIIGNEGNGVPGALGARADVTITIPCPGPVESLNAAVAASVLLYEAARQRAARTAR